MQHNKTRVSSFNETVLVTFRQMVKFGVVGVVNTTITLGLIFLLKDVAGLNYYLANWIGYTAGFINSFTWNKLWTFKGRNHPVLEMVLFAAVFGVSWLLQAGLVYLLKNGIGIHENISTICGMVFYTPVNFTGNKLITFNKKLGKNVNSKEEN
jgi:putative flippase GtrA